jgi:hypothetical protein
MGRREKPIESDGPVAEFAMALRALRRRAGQPSYRTMAARARYSPSVLSEAACGRDLPH